MERFEVCFLFFVVVFFFFVVVVVCCFLFQYINGVKFSNILKCYLKNRDEQRRQFPVQNALF